MKRTEGDSNKAILARWSEQFSTYAVLKSLQADLNSTTTLWAEYQSALQAAPRKDRPGIEKKLRLLVQRQQQEVLGLSKLCALLELRSPAASAIRVERLIEGKAFKEYGVSCNIATTYKNSLIFCSHLSTQLALAVILSYSASSRHFILQPRKRQSNLVVSITPSRSKSFSSPILDTITQFSGTQPIRLQTNFAQHIVLYALEVLSRQNITLHTKKLSGEIKLYIHFPLSTQMNVF